MNNKYKYLIIVFLIAASFIAFGRTLGNDFVNFDDDRLITENIHVQSGINAENIKWAFTNSSLEYWHPLTWLSIMLEWRLFGANASGYHLVSLLLHIGAVLFLFLFLNKTTKCLWPSAFVAALFALHPLRVESVAWAAEHKDVLSMFFGMATLYAYAYYVEKPQISKYLLCLLLFVLSLMSKPTLVTLPCVLLLLDYWPLARLQKQLTPVNIPVVAEQKTGKKKSKQSKAASPMEKKIAVPVKSTSPSIGNILWEKAPFFLLSLALGAMLIWQLRADNQMVSLQVNPFSERLMNSIVSYVSYLWKTFCPSGLAVFYPYEHSFQFWQVFGAASVLLLISVAVVYMVKRAPFLAVGWFWYLGTLFPVIGLMQAGDQAMADRYTYFPSVGIGIMLTWGIVYLLPKENFRKIIMIPAAAIVLTVLTVLTWQQCGYWKNGIELFNHALQATKNNYLAHYGLGFALATDGKTEKAITHFRAALQINPDDYDTHYNLALALRKQGLLDEAIVHFRKALKSHNNYTKAKVHNNLAVCLDEQGMHEEAITHYFEAIKNNSTEYFAYVNLANALARQGKVEEACTYYRKALSINPDDSTIHISIGTILGKQRKHDEALYHFRQALRVNPADPVICFNLGIALASTGKIEEAIEYLRRAVYLKPDYEEARQVLGVVLAIKEKQKR